SRAAVTPIPVPVTGVGPITFDTLPGLANGWSIERVPATAGTAGDLATVANFDIAANTNDVAAMVTALGTDAAVTNSTTMFGNASSTSANFRWNSAGHFLESRPTGNAYAILLATFANNSGQARNNVTISCDYGLDAVSRLTTREPAGG